jgi:hypothetical protein
MFFTIVNVTAANKAVGMIAATVFILPLDDQQFIIYPLWTTAPPTTVQSSGGYTWLTHLSDVGVAL